MRRSDPCRFESGHRHHVGAKSALLRRLFMPAAKKDVIRPLPCSSFPNRNRWRWVAVWVPKCARVSFCQRFPRRSKVRFAPPFQTATAGVGLRFGFLNAHGYLSVNASHVGAKSALLRRLFMPAAKKDVIRPLTCRFSPNRSGLVLVGWRRRDTGNCPNV